MRFPPSVAEQLEYYVYGLFADDDSCPFYVGKGRRDRVFSHLRDDKNGNPMEAAGESLDAASAIEESIGVIRRCGAKDVRLELLRWNLGEQSALEIEATLIDVLKPRGNRARGIGTEFGRVPIEDLIERLGPVELPLPASCLILVVNRLWRRGMSSQELKSIASGLWEIDPRRADRKPIVVSANGVVRGIFELAPGASWERADDARDDRVFYDSKGACFVRARNRFERDYLIELIRANSADENVTLVDDEPYARANNKRVIWNIDSLLVWEGWEELNQSANGRPIKAPAPPNPQLARFYIDQGRPLPE